MDAITTELLERIIRATERIDRLNAHVFAGDVLSEKVKDELDEATRALYRAVTAMREATPAPDVTPVVPS